MTVEAAVTRFVRAQTAPSSIVRREHPMAGAHSLANYWTIYTNEVPQTVLGTGKTALLAWRDAARNVMSNDEAHRRDAAGGTSGGVRRRRVPARHAERTVQRSNTWIDLVVP